MKARKKMMALFLMALMAFSGTEFHMPPRTVNSFEVMKATSS